MRQRILALTLLLFLLYTIQGLLKHTNIGLLSSFICVHKIMNVMFKDKLLVKLEAIIKKTTTFLTCNAGFMEN